VSQHRKRLRDPRRYTLTELEEHDWGPATFDSWLVQTAHQLRYRPLKDLTAGDLRLLIGQHIGLQYLIPLALEALAEDPLVEATFYPGDLLEVVLRVPPEFWKAHSAMASQALTIARKAHDHIDTTEVGRHASDELLRFIETQSGKPLR
jgi:hypothetical protein